ncbi:hypothetical protein MKQ70_06665 [Chitinophaga sedimenti]|uniref:Calx-beta domain-containing protein n=1 Tax=Chitinophaga sedimenti TaxID=2033606 RepID=UPI002004E703|nr:Calx-beta domain-containing protein [Chitinophaga sedimenti]MCK7554699.1 hypothetical protein [Chitinophaga sedimenti]
MDIADDDADPINMILSITNGAHAAEPSTNGSFIISLPAGTLLSQDVTVTYTVAGTATAGTDYTALSGTAVIPAMGNSVTIPVTVLNDELIEQLETVTVTLTNSSAAIGAFTIGAANSATVNISDDDAVNLKLGVTATQPAAAEPATNGGFTISIAGGKLTSEAITVQYTIGGSATPDADYQAISGIITIPAGASSVIVPVNVLNDDEVEDPETVVFTITGGTAANFSWTPDTNNEAIVTITSDDAHTGNLMITKQMVSPAIGPYRLGQDITYRVTVTNIGTGVSAGVTVADFLASQLGQPARTVASIGQTSFNATDLRIDWTIGDMAAGATAQLEVTYRLTDGVRWYSRQKQPARIPIQILPIIKPA